MLTIEDRSATEIAFDAARRMRRARLDQDLTQQGLADRAGVSLASLRRFERTGNISFVSLVRLAFVLDTVSGVDALFAAPRIRTLDDLDDGPRRQRGRRS